MIKKYEIITVGGSKRVRALRSWQVGDRYVNIGDVGGIVYDEKTLSQDGACWLFKGNFGFPGARIGGDSIVDVGEAALSTVGSPAVDILGSSVVVGRPLRFVSRQTTADAVVLTEAAFEQGALDYSAGTNWETWKTNSTNYLRTKAPIFMGGVSTTLSVKVPGYSVRAYVLDRDGIGITITAPVDTGEDVTLTVPGGQYFVLRLSKNPPGPIVPADATAAQIMFTGTYETKLSVVDSRVEVIPANATGTAAIHPGGTYTIASGVKYPEAIIRNSKVSINSPGAAGRSFRLHGQIIGSTATLDATAGDVVVAGSYSNVKNITASGVLTTNTGVSAYNIIQATDCDNFAVSPTVFPGMAAAQAANMPFIFQGCNVPNGIFYHNAKAKNVYTDIDFSKASADLGKALIFGTLCSSEVEGMYRVYHEASEKFGALVESYDSIKDADFSALETMVATTIYKDAKLTGLFSISGTNVFGGTGNHGGGKGCEITNTKETAAVIAGNVRVEGNATVKDVSIAGTGYFGEDSVTEAPAALAAPMPIEGMAYMSGKAVFKPGTVNATAGLTILDMRGNAVFNGALSAASTFFNVSMFNSAIFSGTLNARNGFVMRGNSYVASSAVIASACRGLLVLKDKARVEAGTLTAVGAITLGGTYKQTAGKTWTGNRTISSESEPTYENNVKTKYDF